MGKGAFCHFPSLPTAMEPYSHCSCFAAAIAAQMWVTAALACRCFLLQCEEEEENSTNVVITCLPRVSRRGVSEEEEHVATTSCVAIACVSMCPICLTCTIRESSCIQCKFLAGFCMVGS